MTWHVTFSEGRTSLVCQDDKESVYRLLRGDFRQELEKCKSFARAMLIWKRLNRQQVNMLKYGNR